MTNVVTGEDRIVKGCHFQTMPFLITESIKASNVATDTAASMRNEIARGYSTLAKALPGFVKTLAENIDEEEG